jgi:hypothetical protein
MQYFTQEDLKPSEKTLQLIRQVAYSYQLLQNGNQKDYCLN